MDDLEKEIQVRINFKLTQLLESLRKEAKRNWDTAYMQHSEEHLHYWEAFNKMAVMLQKEMAMPVPSNRMYEDRKRELRNKAIEKIEEIFRLTGHPDDQAKIKYLDGVIEDAQRL